MVRPTKTYDRVRLTIPKAILEDVERLEKEFYERKGIKPPIRKLKAA